MKQRSKSDIIDVANAAGVSPSTVSRSFNHPELLRPQTRQKIERAVQQLGYIRNRAAQTIHGRRSGTIGLVVPTINHAIFSEVIQAFSESVEQEGFTILIASHHYDLDREYALLRKFLEHRVDGVAVIGLEHSEATYQLIEQQEVPAIAIWNFSPSSRISCVGAANSRAGEIAAHHLIELGHRQIALAFPSPLGNDRASERLRGVREELARNSITIRDSWQIEVRYSLAQAKSACLELLRPSERPTALLCGNDVIAQGAIFAAQSLNLEVPRDLSVIGIGDFKGSDEMEPGLTTVRIPARRIGKIAGAEMARAITEQSRNVLRRECDVEFILRQTTRAVVATG